MSKFTSDVSLRRTQPPASGRASSPHVLMRLLVCMAFVIGLLTAGGIARAAPDPEAACVAQLSAFFASQETRDDIQLFHNPYYKQLGVTPGAGLQYVVEAHGTLSYCLSLLPPGLVIPPHP